MKSAAVLFGLALSLTLSSYGQTPTVTNWTLEKYKTDRLAAERDYRENYAKMGFPSPEELNRQRDANMDARLKLAEQLRQARLEKERIELERQGLALESEEVIGEASYQAGSGGVYWGAYSFGGYGRQSRYRSPRRHLPVVRYPSNRLLPMVDRSTYRYTPFGPVRVPNVRPAIVVRGGRGLRR
jgi:hypothetical protein